MGLVAESILAPLQGSWIGEAKTEGLVSLALKISRGEYHVKSNIVYSLCKNIVYTLKG